MEAEHLSDASQGTGIFGTSALPLVLGVLGRWKAHPKWQNPRGSLELIPGHFKFQVLK